MIDAQHLVTAAHCVQAHDYFHAYVDEAMSVHLLDDGSLSVAGEDAKAPLHVESCTLHPRSEEPGFDLAVCRLSAGTNILPATFTRTNPTEGEQLILVGYGFDQVGGEAGTKRYVESSISGIASDVDGQELVIGDHMRGTCRGDSGGPAFRLADNGDDMVLVGLLSGGESGRCGFGWYTNLPLHLNWLEEVTQKTLAIEPVMAVASHTHFDHIGSHHEFSERAVHPAEAELLARPDRKATLADPFATAEMFEALPPGGWDEAAYAITPAPATQLLEDGEIIDLGDRHFEVLHLPGHSPGSIALWEAASAILFSGDTVYDGPLVDDCAGADRTAYRQSMERLLELPVRVVHGGHFPSFGRDRLRALIRAWLEGQPVRPSA